MIVNTIAITGSSGFIGQYLVAELTRFSKKRVKLLSRNEQYGLNSNFLQHNSLGPEFEVVCGDLRDSESLKGFLEPGCIVINLAYQRDTSEIDNLNITNNLLKACQHAQINRLIHCSTADVVGGSKGFFDFSILRPTSVFGPGGKNLKILVDNLIKGNRLHNHFKHYLFGKRRMNLVHVENVVAALLFLTKCEKSFDKEVFFISDSDSPANNFSQVECTFLQNLCLDYGFLDLALPPSFLEFLLRLRERDNINPRRDYSPRKLISLGFVRPVSFESGLVEYANWYRKSHSLG